MALIDTVTSMAEEVTERQRRDEQNTRRRAKRQMGRIEERAREETATQTPESRSLLGISMAGPRGEGDVRNRYSSRDRSRERGRPQASPRMGQLPTTAETPQRDVASYHDSQYAGNAAQQGQPYYMPPPLDVGYDLGTVLANMNQRFLENRKRAYEHRAIQVAQFQAANRVRQEQNQDETPGPVNPTPDNPAPGSSGGGGAPPQTGTGPVANPVQPTIGTSGTYGGGGNGMPITGLPTAGDVLGQINRWNTPSPIIWSNSGN